MNPRPTITREEARVLRWQVHGKGNLERLGFIVVTDKGREWIAKEDERVKAQRKAGGQLGAKWGRKGKSGKLGGRPKEKGDD